jgi:hypothetical protein
MNVLAEAAQHAPAWKNWAYVGAGLGLCALAGLWELVAQLVSGESTDNEDDDEESDDSYEAGCVPTILFIAGIIMMLNHVFDLRF